MICDQCETVAHCLKNGCVPKTTKQTEALKLALETVLALTAKGPKKPPSGQAYAEAVAAITTIREALAEESSGTEQPAILECAIQARPLSYSLHEYHIAMSEGPLHYTWTDKPHRLVYDLIAAVKYYAAPQPAQLDMNLNCKSVQARLATSWGYVKAEQPAQRCPLCNYQHGHAIGCKNNPVDIALAKMTEQPAQPQQENPCDMGGLCIGCSPRNADGRCPGEKPNGACDCYSKGFSDGLKEVEQPAQQQEPVAWAMYQRDQLLSFWMDKSDAYDFEFTPEHSWTPLYTSPPAQCETPRKPLTDEEIERLAYRHLDVGDGPGAQHYVTGDIAFARAIEAAHQIGVEK